MVELGLALLCTLREGRMLMGTVPKRRVFHMNHLPFIAVVPLTLSRSD